MFNVKCKVKFTPLINNKKNGKRKIIKITEMDFN